MMGTQALLAAAPSGRVTPLLIDDGAYTQTVVRQGQPVPWADLAELLQHLRKVCALLNPDAIWVDVEALINAHLAQRPTLLTDMGKRARPGYALRTLLGDESLAESVRSTLEAVADSVHRRIVLDVPSPARWVARAHALVGSPLEGVSEDLADSASMYLADWMGNFGRVPVALVMLDARGSEPDVVAESLATYTTLTNVAAHFEWSIGLRNRASVETVDGDPTIGLLPEAFWETDGEIPRTDLIVSTIPATAAPERVLDRLMHSFQ